MTFGAISAIEYYLPANVLSTADLAAMYPEWSIEKIDRKTGICERHVASGEEYVSDMAIAAAKRLFDADMCKPGDIDYCLLCTQSPDHLIPTTACVLQERLGLPNHCGCLDFNLGCSGYVYGIGLAEALIRSCQARTVLLITAETYTKLLRPGDKACRTIFSDGAAATLITQADGDQQIIGPFVYGTDGKGARFLRANGTGTKAKSNPGPGATETATTSNDAYLFMDGPKVFDFAIAEVPKVVHALLRKACLDVNAIDLFVFHQANAFLLEEIRRILDIPSERFFIGLSKTGNTVSSTIPIALKQAVLERRLRRGNLVMVVGFGVGLSWAATIIRWTCAS